MKKKFGQKFSGRKFFLLQNHFLGNSLDEKKFGRTIFRLKIFLADNFFVCKIISSESLDEKHFS